MFPPSVCGAGVEPSKAISGAGLLVLMLASFTASFFGNVKTSSNVPCLSSDKPALK